MTMHMLPPVFSLDDVLWAIHQLLYKKSCGLDNIPNFIVKDCVDLLARILCHVPNMSLRQSIFPDVRENAWRSFFSNLAALRI